jgi:hypothetical protein
MGDIVRNRYTEEDYVAALKYYAKYRILYKASKTPDPITNNDYTIEEIVKQKLREKCVYDPTKRNWHKFNANSETDKQLLKSQRATVAEEPIIEESPPAPDEENITPSTSTPAPKTAKGPPIKKSSSKK